MSDTAIARTLKVDNARWTDLFKAGRDAKALAATAITDVIEGVLETLGPVVKGAKPAALFAYVMHSSTFARRFPGVVSCDDNFMRVMRDTHDAREPAFKTLLSLYVHRMSGTKTNTGVKHTNASLVALLNVGNTRAFTIREVSDARANALDDNYAVAVPSPRARSAYRTVTREQIEHLNIWLCSSPAVSPLKMNARHKKAGYLMGRSVALSRLLLNYQLDIEAENRARGFKGKETAVGGEGNEEKEGMNREACKRVLQAPRQVLLSRRLRTDCVP